MICRNMKIAVYTITKNEEQFVERWAESCKDADYRLIVDTGSSDNTVHIAELAGCHTASIVVSPWRFDDARNAALSLLPADIDYCIALDADEVLTPGWREALEKVDPSVTRPRYKYVWSWTAGGEEGLVYSGDKIHARHGYKWVHPVHEVITPINGESQGWVDLQIHHHPDPTKSRSQYLPLLELAVRERPDDDRNRFYLGRELMFNLRYEEAKEHLERHLELSVWPPERATSMRYLGRVTNNKAHWIMRACAEAPHRREPWVDLSKFYYEIGNWPGCYFAAMQALAITEKPLEYLCEEEAWGQLPYDMACVSLWNLNRKEESFLYGKEAVKINPVDKRLTENVAMILQSIVQSKVLAVIPTKSNLDGLKNTIESLLIDPAVRAVAVVCETREAQRFVIETFKEHLDTRVLPISTDEELGIHHMWNTGMSHARPGEHCLFINDDVSIDGLGVSTMAGFLDINPDVGLICPNYDNRVSPEILIETDDTCKGRYDGTGGMGGFCMMLSSDLASSWTFDEKMIWWYGDDDVLHWVRSRNRKAGILTVARCTQNESWTLVNDPPKNFLRDVENDRLLFEKKWNK